MLSENIERDEIDPTEFDTELSRKRHPKTESSAMRRLFNEGYVFDETLHVSQVSIGFLSLLNPQVAMDFRVLFGVRRRTMPGINTKI